MQAPSIALFPAFLPSRLAVALPHQEGYRSSDLSSLDSDDTPKIMSHLLAVLYKYLWKYLLAYGSSHKYSIPVRVCEPIAIDSIIFIWNIITATSPKCLPCLNYLFSSLEVYAHFFPFNHSVIWAQVCLSRLVSSSYQWFDHMVY
jgi:hypothetical protein